MKNLSKKGWNTVIVDQVVDWTYIDFRKGFFKGICVLAPGSTDEQYRECKKIGWAWKVTKTQGVSELCWYVKPLVAEDEGTEFGTICTTAVSLV